MMKKLKVFFVILCLVLLSGCDATYEINIKNDQISENLKVIETDKSIFDKETDSGWTIRDSFEALLGDDEFAAKDYDVKSLSDDNQLGVEYSSSSESLINLSLLNQCYTNPKVSIEDDIVSIDTGTDFECYDYYENLNNIKVILKTNHKIISTNADIIEGDSYIWNITKDSNKQIKVSYYESIVDKSLDSKTILLIGVGILIIGIGIYFVINKMKNKNNI